MGEERKLAESAYLPHIALKYRANGSVNPDQFAKQSVRVHMDRMQNAVKALSEREAEVLRLLLSGHCAKSIAQRLGLSVHAVNERLRNARRKLGVSSSREAARLLAEADSGVPKHFVGIEQQVPKLAVANGLELPPHNDSPHNLLSERGEGSQITLTSFAGGVLIMTLIAAAVILTDLVGGTGLVGLGRLNMNNPGREVIAETAASSASPLPAEFSPLPISTAAAQLAQAGASQVPMEVDLMPFADTDSDSLVTMDEYRKFSELGWIQVSSGSAQVRLSELNPLQAMTFIGIMPNAEGVITREMYVAAIPARFHMLDHNEDGMLTGDELSGKHFQGQAPPQL